MALPQAAPDRQLKHRSGIDVQAFTRGHPMEELLRPLTGARFNFAEARRQPMGHHVPASASTLLVSAFARSARIGSTSRCARPERRMPTGRFVVPSLQETRP